MGAGAPGLPPGAPPKPQVDETATLSYTTPSGLKAEIVGVCKVTEDSVSCWDADGEPMPDLQQRVEWALSHGPWDFISLTYKKKNRLVVAETVTPIQRVSTAQGFFAGGLSLESVGDGRWRGSLQLDQPNGMAFTPGKPMKHLEGRFTATERNERTTSAYFSYVQQIPTRETLALRTGASCHIGDAGLEIASIVQGGKLPGRPTGLGYMGPSEHRPEWTITVKILNPKSKYRISLQVDNVYVDSNGRIVSQHEVEKAQEARSQQMREFAGKPHGPGEAIPGAGQLGVKPVSFRLAGGSEAEVAYVVDADPAEIKRITATATRSERIELKGIRLDPK
jgi:hypothetical protein